MQTVFLTMMYLQYPCLFVICIPISQSCQLTYQQSNDPKCLKTAKLLLIIFNRVPNGSSISISRVSESYEELILF